MKCLNIIRVYEFFVFILDAMKFFECLEVCVFDDMCVILYEYDVNSVMFCRKFIVKVKERLLIVSGL